ncbi:N-acetylneuraminate lyase-like isoform X1 [Anoplophora glabripennis]|uniref:N-acetylneuraminate lyase-like isoform X1 n=1 Tax=Anoplophora glabripennis TaxID=217634 RepID=UPI000C766C71|nr:N-acetylneuraminate lyase-like isoform X1 [Anoplophora glabripennis]
MTDWNQEREIENRNSEKMNEVKLDVIIGQVFPAFDDLEETVIKTCKENSVQFYRRDSRKIENAVKRNAQKNYNPEIVYSEIKYACIYGGRKFRSQGVGVRKSKTFKKECPAYIKAVATNDGQQLIIKSICSTHNHPVVKGNKRKNSITDNNVKKIRLQIEHKRISKDEIPLPIEFIDVLIDEEYKPNVNFTFRGLCAPVFTVFNNDLSVNVKIIPEYAKYLASNGLKGVLVHGTSGEGMSMTVAERKSVVEEWVKAVKITKQHLMVQVGGCPLPDALELAKHAEQVGVDSLLCLPELYFKPSTPAQLIDYLKIVGEAAPRTPLLYYHIPGWSGVNINMAQFLNESVGKIPTFHGIKYTSNDLDGGVAALRANNGKYAVFLGADTLLAGAFAMGFDSAIATTLNVLPQYSIQILEAIKANKVDEAREIQNKLTDACSIITKNGAWVPTMKAAMNLVTPINVGAARPPLSNLSTNHVNEMQRLLTAASVL